MRVATFNVNSIKQRVDQVTAWLAARQPDVVALQELKCVDEAFPREPFERLGYNIATHGQKTYNGVALLSRRPMEDIVTGLPGEPADEQARYIEALVAGDRGMLRVGGLYLPNGNPPDTEKYPYKLRWMDRLIAHARDRLALEEPLVLAGDYNVIPTAADCHDPRLWAGDALFLPTTREKFQTLTGLGFTDAIRATDDRPALYTFWDYQAGAWPRNNGIRIDHLMLSPQAADKLTAAGIDRDVRGQEKPSDHVPVWCDLDL
jgi:exodeoxyribonuclease-3